MIKSFTTYYDERNRRYIATFKQGCDRKVWLCEVEELNDDEYEATDRQLFTETELRHFTEV